MGLMAPASFRSRSLEQCGSFCQAVGQKRTLIASVVALVTVLLVSFLPSGTPQQRGGLRGWLPWSRTAPEGLQLSYKCRPESWAKLEIPDGQRSMSQGSGAAGDGGGLALMENAYFPELPNVTTIVRTYHNDGAQIAVLLQSLLVASLGHVNLNIVVINVDVHGREQLTKVIAVVNGLCRRQAVRLALEWSFCGRPVPAENFMYGYDATDAAMATVLRETASQPDRGGWLLVTNGDNAYSRFFFEAIKQHMDGPAQVISTRFTTNHHREVPGHGSQRNSVLPATHVPSMIDLGSFVTRVSRIRKFGSHFVVGVSDRKRLFMADWLFLESLQLEGDEFANIPRVLFSHQ